MYCLSYLLTPTYRFIFVTRVSRLCLKPTRINRNHRQISCNLLVPYGYAEIRFIMQGKKQQKKKVLRDQQAACDFDDKISHVTN